MNVKWSYKIQKKLFTFNKRESCECGCLEMNGTFQCITNSEWQTIWFRDIQIDVEIHLFMLKIKAINSRAVYPNIQ